MAIRQRMMCTRETPFRNRPNVDYGWPVPKGEWKFTGSGSGLQWKPVEPALNILTLSSNSGSWIVYCDGGSGSSYRLGAVSDKEDPTELPDFEPV